MSDSISTEKKYALHIHKLSRDSNNKLQQSFREKNWRFIAALHGTLFSLTCFLLAFSPLYTVHMNNPSEGIDNEWSLTCYFFYASASVADKSCQDTSGWQACYSSLHSSGQCDNTIFVSLDEIGSYSTTVIICYIVILFLSALCTFILLASDKIEMLRHSNTQNILLSLHLVTLLAGTIVIQQTGQILQASKYSNENGATQTPVFGLGTYMLMAIPLLLLSIDVYTSISNNSH